MIFGILSAITCFVPGLGLVLGVAGIALSGEPRKKLGGERGMGLAGLICGLIGAATGFFMTLTLCRF